MTLCTACFFICLSSFHCLEYILCSSGGSFSGAMWTLQFKTVQERGSKGRLVFCQKEACPSWEYNSGGTPFVRLLCRVSARVLTRVLPSFSLGQTDLSYMYCIHYLHLYPNLISQCYMWKKSSAFTFKKRFQVWHRALWKLRDFCTFW